MFCCIPKVFGPIPRLFCVLSYPWGVSSCPKDVLCFVLYLGCFVFCRIPRVFCVLSYI